MDRAKLLGPSCGVQAAAAICERVADPAPGYHQDSGAEGLRMSEAASSSLLKFFQWSLLREIEKFNIRQPPKGEKDDYDSENSWISDGFPSSSRQRRREDGR